MRVLRIMWFILALLWITVAFLRAGEMLPFDQTQWVMDVVLLAMFAMLLGALEGGRRER